MAKKIKSKSSKAKAPAKGKAKGTAKPKPKAKSRAAKTTKPKTTKKRAQKAVQRSAPAQVLPRDLEERLSALAIQMDKTMDALMLQALCEFADAWEDHYRTIQAMTDEDDRIQLVVKPGEA